MNETKNRFSVEFLLTPDKGAVRFYNPSADNIPLHLLSCICKALEQVEKEYKI